jgi:CheY-like chemotaxis protein/MinD-like ATPase involved in chromosome partitioning or flagellar assembly
MAEKILVVDDDIDTLRLVGLMLERQGYQIIAASTGQQALSLARIEKPDLILLDLMMPDIDGITVARRLRSGPETKEILIIMFTAKGQTDDKLEGFGAGADDYLTKPTQPRELIAHVKAVLKRAGMKPAIPSKEYTARGRVFGVLAAKGGVGVSTVTTNLGISLHLLSKRPVVISDFRPGCGTIGLELGIANPLGQSKLLTSDASLITPDTIDPELTLHPCGARFLLASARPQDASYIGAVDHFTRLAQQIAYLSSFVMLDLGASLVPAVEKVLECCEQVIIVLEPVPQTVYQTRLLLDYLAGKMQGENRLQVALVNRLRAGMQLSLGQVQDQLGHNVAAIFPAAPELAYQAQVSATPIVLRQPDGVVTQQFNNLAERLVGKSK